MLTCKKGEKESSSNVSGTALCLLWEFGDHKPIQDKSTDAMVNPEFTLKAEGVDGMWENKSKAKPVRSGG